MKKSTKDADGERKAYVPHRPSQLFLLRVWIEGNNENNVPEDVAGKVQDPVSGAVHYFSGGLELVRILHRTISQKEASGPAQTADHCQS